MKIRQGFVSNSSSSSFIISGRNHENFSEEERWNIFCDSYRTAVESIYTDEEVIQEVLESLKEEVMDLIKENRLAVYYKEDSKTGCSLFDNDNSMCLLGLTSKFLDM